MNILELNNYLLSKGRKKKIVSDTISRLKRINNELIIIGTNIDYEYSKNRCAELMRSFNRKCPNSKKILLGSSLPLDKPEIANYKYAVKQYVSYLESK